MQGEAGEIEDLVVVDVAHDHHVHLHRGKAEGEHGLDTPPDRGEAVHPGDLGHPLGPERVEADIDLAHPGGAQRPGRLGQEHAVGGQADIVQALDPGQLTDEVEHPAAHQRFAAGEAHLGDAHGHRHPHHPQQFLIGKQVLVAEARQTAAGLILADAVAAAQVAAISQAEAQVGDGAGKEIGQAVFARG